MADMPQSGSTFQDLQRARQGEVFVGRATESVRFEETLLLPPRDPRRRSVIGIYGQSGMGKTSFLERCRAIAQAADYGVAWSNNSAMDLLEVLEALALDLDEESAFATFQETLGRYREARLEMEGHENAPEDLARAIGARAGKVGVKLARRVPVAGLAAELLEEDNIGEGLAELAAFVVRHSKSKAAAELLLNPVEKLSPLFVEGLATAMAEQSLALFFDTYEETRYLVEPWLLTFLGGHFGDFPPNLLIAIAGRNRLDANSWGQKESLLDLIELGPLSGAESREYLQKKGFTDSQRIAEIVALAKGVPIRLVTLAISKSGEIKPTDTAVDRLLQGFTEPQRRAAVEAAVPRLVNRDIVEGVLGLKVGIFEWLRDLPFVEATKDGWEYHSVVRRELLEFGRRESPTHVQELNERLGKYHADQVKTLQDSGDPRRSAFHGREALYHDLQAEYKKSLRHGLRGCTRLWNIEPSAARRWVSTIAAAEEDSATPAESSWGRKWRNAIDEMRYGHEQPAIELFSDLMSTDLVEDAVKAELLEARGGMLRNQGRYDEALKDLKDAGRISPDLAKYPYLRAATLVDAEKFDQALNECECALGMLSSNDSNYMAVRTLYVRIAASVVGPQDALELANELLTLEKHPGALSVRGQIHRDLGNAAQAIRDFEEVKRLAPSREHQVEKEIGLTYIGRGEWPKAKSAFQRAVNAHPECGGCWRRLAECLSRTERSQDAVVQILRATCSDLNAESLHGYRGWALMGIGLEETALAELKQAVQVEPHNPEVHLWLGRVHLRLKDWTRAKHYIDEVLRLEPNWPAAVATHGYYAYGTDDYQRANHDWSRAEELCPGEKLPVSLSDRGLCLAKLGNLEQALAFYKRAIATEPGPEVMYNRAIVEILHGDDSERSQPFVNEALEALGKEDVPQGVAAYGRAGLHAVRGEKAEALEALAEAVEIDGERCRRWAMTDPAWKNLRRHPSFEDAIDIEGTSDRPRSR